MLVVAASVHDERARRIAAHWGPGSAALLTAEDLCRPGWQLAVPRSADENAVIGGKIVPSRDISGVLTLRPRVFPEELYRIRPVDRAYVAAELTAFLQAWLASRTCPVLNRPSAACLAGPNWRPAQWTHAAAGLGIPVRTQRSGPDRDGAPEGDAAVEIVAIGERCLGSDDPVLAARTLRLAKKAGVELLQARFTRTDGRFLSAHAWPDLTGAAVLAALRERFEAGR